MAAPVVESFNTNTATGATSLSLTKPSSVATDDLLMIIVGNDDSTSSTTFDAITGWTKLNESGDSTADCKLAVYYRVADGTEGASETVNVSTGSDDFVGWYLRISGVDTTTPINVSTFSQTSSSANNVDCPSVTTTDDDCLVFAIAIHDGGDAFPFTVSGTGWPSSVPTNQELQNSTSGSGVSGVWVTRTVATAGASNNLNVSCGRTDGWAYAQVAVAPDAGGDTTADATAATATGTADNATADVEPSASVASATGAGHDAAVTVEPSAGSASATGTAHDATAIIEPAASAATATGAGHDATADTGGDVTADAGSASATGAGHDAAVTVEPSAGSASATGSGGDAAVTIEVDAEVGTATGTGSDASTTIDSDPLTGAGSGTGHDASGGVEPSALVATATGTAHDATVIVSPVAEVATGTGAGHDATGPVVPVTTDVTADAWFARVRYGATFGERTDSHEPEADRYRARFGR